jgi:HTH-type transcriptional regulator / antitoxin HigA
MTTGLKVPSNYLQLINAFPPRPISNEAELLATQKQINLVIDRSNLTTDDRDYLKILGMLVYEYESQHEVFPQLKGVDFLKSMIEDMGLTPKDLVPILGDETIVMDILNDRVTLTPTQVQQLAVFFQVSPGAIVVG